MQFGQKAGFEMNTSTLAEGRCGMWLHLVERRWPPRLGTWLSAFWWASVPGSSTGGDESPSSGCRQVRASPAD